MVPQYDDDDIIEDYEEISDSAGDARRVASASGGPVQRPRGNDRPVRPSDHVRPATTTVPQAGNGGGNGDDDYENAPKGKITQKSARNIWIVCIAICVIGIGAVLADVVFDAFGRHKKAQAGVSNTNDAAPNRAPTRGNQRELTPRQKLEREFKSDVYAQVKQMDSSKAWDFYWTAVLKFEDARSKALELKNDKENTTPDERKAAWAEAITHYYKAKYAAELFRHRFDEDRVSMEYLPFAMDDLAAVPDEELKNPRIRTYQAADVKITTKATNVNRFQTDVIKYELEANNVHSSDEWAEKTFGEWRDKLEAARGNPPQFDEEHLDFVFGPDYESGEKTMYQKYLEDNPG